MNGVLFWALCFLTVIGLFWWKPYWEYKRQRAQIETVTASIVRTIESYVDAINSVAKGK